MNSISKLADVSDLPNFKPDQILSFIFLANTHDSEAIDKILEHSSDLAFDEMYKIVEKLELSRNLKDHLPHNKNQAIFRLRNRKTNAKNKGIRFRSKSRGRPANRTANISSKKMLADMAARRICPHCGRHRCMQKPCIYTSLRCGNCGLFGHKAVVCMAYKGKKNERQESQPERSNRSFSARGRRPLTPHRSHSRNHHSHRSKSSKRSQRGRSSSFRPNRHKNNVRIIDNKTENEEYGEIQHLADLLTDCEINNSSETINKVNMIRHKVSRIAPGTASPEFAVKYGPLCRALGDTYIVPFIAYTLADSGSSRSILPSKIVSEKKLPFKEAKNESLFAANQAEMSILGQLFITATYGKKSILINALISEDVDTPILSWYDSAKLNLLAEIEKKHF